MWGGNTVIGRRAARLATVLAALSIYPYGVLAVAVHGATGHDPSDGWTTAQIIADNLADQAVFYLLALPLATATIGWAAAAVTARLRHAHHQPAGATPNVLPITPDAGGALRRVAAGSPLTPEDHRAPTRPRPGDAVPGATATAARQRRMWYLLVLCAALVTVAFLIFLTFLSPR